MDVEEVVIKESKGCFWGGMRIRCLLLGAGKLEQNNARSESLLS